MNKKFNIVEKINLEKLDYELKDYIVHRKESPYIFMNKNTLKAIGDTISVRVGQFIHDEKYKDAELCMYLGYRVYINNDLDFGEVEIR